MSESDANGFTVSYETDYAGRTVKTTRTVDGEVQTASVQYNSLGLKTAQTDYLGNTSTFEYDMAGRLLKQTSPVDDGTFAITKTYYDALGNVTVQKVWIGEIWRKTEVRQGWFCV